MDFHLIPQVVDDVQGVVNEVFPACCNAAGGSVVGCLFALGCCSVVPFDLFDLLPWGLLALQHLSWGSQ